MEAEEKKSDTLRKKITRKAFKGGSLNEESINAAIDEMRLKRKTGEVVVKSGDILYFVKDVLKKSVTIEKIKYKMRYIFNIASLVILIMLLGVSIGIPAYQEYSWKTCLTMTRIDYERLDKAVISSIKDFNNQHNAHFYYLNNMEKGNSYIYTLNNKRIILEEEYLYNDISCTMYIINKNTEISGIDIQLEFEQFYFIKDLSFNLNQYENDLFISFQRDYQYYIKISSTDLTLIDPILYNLTKRI